MILGFILGLVTGGTLGFFCCACIVLSRDADRRTEQERERRKEAGAK